MEALFEAGARGRIGEMKELYAQLFLLMNDSLEDGLNTEGKFERAEKLDPLIADLMQAISQRSDEFQNYLAAHGELGLTCPPEFVQEIDHFQKELASGLTAMLGFIHERIDEFTKTRDAVKDQLKQLQEKKLTQRAYPQSQINPPSTILSSEA